MNSKAASLQKPDVIGIWPDGYPIIRPGDRVRVTYLTPLIDKRGVTVVAAGVVWVGTAGEVLRDGEFQVYIESMAVPIGVTPPLPDLRPGIKLGWCVRDPGIRVEVVSPTTINA